jgi:heme A synthase
MKDGLFHAHSGLRFLILLVGIVAVVNYTLARRSKRAPSRGDRILMAIFTGLLDLQLLLGVGIVATGLFYPALMGHIGMMVFAVVLAHVCSVAARRTTDPVRAHTLRLVGALGALLLIVGGIQAIGRAILGTGVPSM